MLLHKPFIPLPLQLISFSSNAVIKALPLTLSLNFYYSCMHTQKLRGTVGTTACWNENSSWYISLGSAPC